MSCVREKVDDKMNSAWYVRIFPGLVECIKLKLSNFLI